MVYRFFMAPVVLIALANAVVSAHAATPEEAKAFSERAAAYIKQQGEEKAFADFTRLTAVLFRANSTCSAMTATA